MLLSLIMSNEQPPDDDFEQDQQPRSLLDRIGDYGLALAQGTLPGQDAHPGFEQRGTTGGWVTRSYDVKETRMQGVSLTVRAFDPAANDISIRFEWHHYDPRGPVTLPIPIINLFWNESGRSDRPEAAIFQISTLERHEDPAWLTQGRVDQGFVTMPAPGWYAKINPFYSEAFLTSPRQSDRSRTQRDQQIQAAIKRYRSHAPLETLPHYADAEEALRSIQGVAMSRIAERAVGILSLLAHQTGIMSVDAWIAAQMGNQP